MKNKKHIDMECFYDLFPCLILIVLRDCCAEMLKNVSNVIKMRQKMSFVLF